MKVPKQYYNISKLLASAFIGCRTEKDDSILSEWENLSKENKSLTNKVLDKQRFVSNNETLSKYPSDNAWQEISPKINSGSKTTFIVREIINYAAIVIMIASLGGFLYWYKIGRVKVEKTVLCEDITHGKKAAKLILADGKTINIIEDKDFTLKEADGTTIKKGAKSIDYSKSEITSNKIIYNTMMTLRGMEFPLTLSDGTKVFLNAESKIKYPVSFSGNTREVEISGEVYFDVVKDKTKPFIVKSGDVNIEVLGTSFNVKGFQNEKEIATTLVEGKVKLSAKGNNVILIPGKQAIFDKEKKSISVKDVDVELYTAWNNGKFIFRNESIENIMNTLQRWYDFEVIYTDEDVKDIVIGASLNRYGKIDPILEIMEKTDLVKIKKHKRIIYISTK